MNSPLARLLATGVACALAALAHYTWIAPLPPRLEVGKPATIRIGHGHRFPESEEAINAAQVNLFVLAPSGAKAKLDPARSGNAVSATFTPAEAGFHRIAFVQDRGVSSRTPAGLKSGGRDVNPNATQAYRTLRTAVAYANTAAGAPASAQPLGLEVELTAALANGVWDVQLLRNGKPAAAVAVEVFLVGAGKAQEAGKTGPDGRVSFRPAPGAKGPAMFSAGFREPAQGVPYDFTNYETSLYVNW